MRWFRISSVPGAGSPLWVVPPPAGALVVSPARRGWRTDSTGSAVLVGSVGPAAHPKVPPRLQGEKTTCMSYLFGRRDTKPADFGGCTLSLWYAPSQGFLETQDADQGRSHSLRASRQRESNSCAAVPLVEVGARSERYAMFLQQRLTPGFGVGVWPELSRQCRRRRRRRHQPEQLRSSQDPQLSPGQSRGHPRIPPPLCRLRDRTPR